MSVVADRADKLEEVCRGEGQIAGREKENRVDGDEGAVEDHVGVLMEERRRRDRGEDEGRARGGDRLAMRNSSRFREAGRTAGVNLSRVQRQ